MRRHLLALLLVPVFAAGMILAAPPATAGHSVTGVDPDSDSGWPGVEDLEVTINGSDFADTETYECPFGDDITTDSCEFDTDSTLIATINIADSAAPGERTVTVTQDGEAEPAECAECFTVNGPTEVEPESAEQGEETTVTISGHGFDDTNAESATCEFEGDDIEIGDEGDNACEIVEDDAGEMVVQATISVDEEAEVTDRDVTVTIFDDTPVPQQEVGSGACEGCFTVTAAQAEPTPTPDPTPTPTPAPTPTPTATSTAVPIDTEEVDPDDGDAEGSDVAPELPDTGFGGVLTFGVAGLGMLGAGLALLGWRRRWTSGRAGAR